MEIYNENGERIDTHQADKKELWKILIISGVIDILTTSGTIASLGTGVVVEELIENIISQIIAKYGKIKLTAVDNAIGALPIPGVTAVTVHCAKKLLAIRAKEQMSKSSFFKG